MLKSHHYIESVTEQKMDSELEAMLKMHPIGLRQFHDLVPLPLGDEEDVGLYYFLAQTSLRELLTSAMEVVGYRSKP